MSSETSASAGQAGGDLEARRYLTVFLPLWVAMVALQSGLLIHDVGAAWIISRETESRSLVALAQTASALPFFLFALPAGALADMVERRRIVQAAAFGLAGLSLVVALAALSGTITVPLLLLASFVNGCCNAAFTPSWQAMTPELVSGERLQGALALNSLGVNIARSIGPLTSGLLLFAAGPAAAFLFNAVLYSAVALAFIMIAPRSAPMAAQESLLSAVRGGLAYVRHERGLQAVALRAVAFFIFAATFWALVPVVVREWFHGTSLMLGLMVGSVGLGAIIGARALKSLRRRFDLDQLMLGAGLLAALAMACVPLAPLPAALAALHAVLGFCWLLSFSSIHLAAQLRLTPWIRARGTAVYLISVFGSLAVGSFASGLLADHLGISVTFWLSAAGLLLATLAAFARLRIAIAAPVKLAHSAILPAVTVLDRDAAIMVTITYAPRDGEQQAAERVLSHLKAARLRTGARYWSSQRTGTLLVERIGYDSGERLGRSAMRHMAEDVAAEAELLGLLAEAPEIAIAQETPRAAQTGGSASK
ncbi:MFS transporter [Bosea caraganae]|nr:MFS transporter [Bosea caraganae]